MIPALAYTNIQFQILVSKEVVVIHSLANRSVNLDLKLPSAVMNCWLAKPELSSLAKYPKSNK